jgi:hypothetical protein
VGFSFVFSQTDLSWDRDRGLEDCPTPPCSVEDPAHAERIRIDTDNVDLHPEVLYDWKFWRWPETIRKVDTGAVSLAFNAGVMARIPRIPELWFALSWISFPTFGGGTVILDGGRSEVIGLEDDGRTGYRLLGDARSGMRLPQIVHFGVRYDLTEDTRLLFGFRWYDLSRHGNLDVRISGPSPASKDVPEVIPRWRGLKDVFSVDGGVEHYFHDRFRAAVQLRLESSGVPARSLAPHQVDAPKAELGFGGEFVIAPNWKATLGYSLALLLPQDTGVSAFDPTQATACRESGFDLDVCEAAREGRAVPSAAGHYSRLTQELTFGFELRFK